MIVAKAQTKITAETKDFDKKIKKSGKDLEKFGKEGKKGLDNLTQSFKNLAGSAAKTGVAFGAVFAGVAAYKSLQFMKDSVRLANEQIKAETKRNAVLKASGGVVGHTAEQLNEMASAFQSVTTFGDEVIIANQAILLSFKNIQGEAFEGTIEAAMNLSTVMGTDLQSSIVMMGKALNDPIANLSAMGRAGVQFEKDQKQLIKTLWQSGDRLGAQKIILKELESQYGGAATAIRDTFAGAVIAARNAWGDFKEQIGFTITKSDDAVEHVQKIQTQFEEWTEYIKDNKEELNEFFNNGLVAAQAMAKATIKIANAIAIIAKYGKYLTPTGAGKAGYDLGREKGGWPTSDEKPKRVYLDIVAPPQKPQKIQPPDGSADKAIAEERRVAEEMTTLLKELRAEEADRLSSINDITEALQREHDTYGYTAEQMALYELNSLGATEATKAEVTALYSKLYAWDAAGAAAEEANREIQDANKTTEDMFKGMFSSMGDALTEFCITGKLNFKELAGSIIQDMIRIQLQQQVTEPLMSAGTKFLTSFVTGLFTAGVGAAGGFTPGAQAGGFHVGAGGTTAFGMAKGGAFPGGISAHSNTIVNTPTQFAFAQGSGLMGEAGPEAIMPLTRMPGGDLGVQTEGGSGSMTVNIHEAPGTTTKTQMSDDGKQLDILIEQVEAKMGSRMARGTGLAPMMDSRYRRGY